MKKKAIILIGLCVLGLCIVEAQATNRVSLPIIERTITDPPQGFEKVNLHGDLLNNVGPNAIVAGASDDAIYIGFNEDLGNVNISIYNGTGNLVYSTVVNTSVQPVVLIPFQNFTSGTYTVELSNAFGYADGDFEHD